MACKGWVASYRFLAWCQGTIGKVRPAYHAVKKELPTVGPPATPPPELPTQAWEGDGGYSQRDGQSAGDVGDATPPHSSGNAGDAPPPRVGGNVGDAAPPHVSCNAIRRSVHSRLLDSGDEPLQAITARVDHEPAVAPVAESDNEEATSQVSMDSQVGRKRMCSKGAEARRAGVARHVQSTLPSAANGHHICPLAGCHHHSLVVTIGSMQQSHA